MFRLLKFNLKTEIFRRWWYFVLVMVLSAACAYICISDITRLTEIGIVEGKISMSDVFAQFYKGMKPYDISKKINFEIDVIYLMWPLILAVFIGMSTQSNMVITNTLLKSHSRVKWWLSKFFSCIISVIFHCMSMNTGILCMCCILNIRGNSINEDLYIHTFGKEARYNNTVGKALFMYLMAFITISLIQLIISFVNVAVGYVACIFIYTMSAYYISPLWIGNMCMIFRYSDVMQNGIGLLETIIVCAVCILSTMIAGAILFKQKDVV